MAMIFHLRSPKYVESKPIVQLSKSWPTEATINKTILRWVLLILPKPTMASCSLALRAGCQRRNQFNQKKFRPCCEEKTNFCGIPMP
jgi:hypothetical protein